MTTTSTNFGAMLEGLLAAKAGHEAEKAELEQNLRATEEKLRLVRDAITSVAPLAGVDPAPLLASTATDAARASASQVESAPSRDLGSEPPTQRRADYDIPTLVIEVACRGKSIADAAIAILALVNRPLTEGVIASFLVEGGVVFTAADRHTAVHYALQRKEKETGAVKEIDAKAGVWGLSAWKETSNPNHLGFVAHRDKASHMEASLRGLQAARASGKRLGVPPKITAEHAPKIAEMMAEGASRKRIAAEFGVTLSGMQKAIVRLRREGHLPEVSPEQEVADFVEANSPWRTAEQDQELSDL